LAAREADPVWVRIPDHEQDKTLAETLAAELSGILLWAINGCLEWQREGLGEPQDVTTATEQYRAGMDLIGQFLAECCEDRRGAEVSAIELHEAFQVWGGKMDRRSLTTKIAERGYQRSRISSGAHKGRTTLLGLRLTTIGEPSGEDSEDASG
jgi:putative DNA primase/helicase